ncbi:MAG: DUF433 domain-containing protein [Abditibacteriales bacterium]|nr:DUF433 domain-containing protein [Abditibacteriales bacterium]
MNTNAAWLPTGVRFGWRLINRLALDIGARPEDVERTLRALKEAGWVRWRRSEDVAVAGNAPRRVPTDLARRLVCRLLGWELTDHPRIVRAPDIQGGTPVIAGTRMLVYAIASAFRAGQGLNAIRQDYPFLTLEEIEAAIHYHLI